MSDNNTNINLTLNIDDFEIQKNQAQQNFNENYSSEESDKHYEWKNMWLDSLDESVEGNTLQISGILKTQNDENLGYININVPLDFDKLIEIFQSYIKKLNKVKTVMESVKDE